ncbi:MAG: LPS assembly protein LptD [Bryobacteraceae bacterium]|nr:LPS assembly protein LptD [Bryobacteraceae bacterium]
MAPLRAQMYQGGVYIPGPMDEQVTQTRVVKPHQKRENAPPPGETLYRSDESQERIGSVVILRGNAEVENTGAILKADQIRYDQESGLAEARGNVHYTDFDRGDEIFADRADYDMKNESGSFYVVSGSTPGHVNPRPGFLTTSEPLRFEGDWAERIKDRYILYEGTLTNCPPGTSWWTLSSPRMIIIPDDHALAYKALLRLKGIPLLWVPAFYKSLEKEARRSGFLTPNIGNSSSRGVMVGAGYFWAINRSYQIMYRPQYYSVRGFAHTVDFSAKPTQNTSFDAYLYGVNDRGLPQSDGTLLKQGGYLASFHGQADALPYGWYARGVVNLLSDFTFRQAFTESFNEAVFSEVNSVAYAAKDWKSYDVSVSYEQQENFRSATAGDKITIRHLPEVTFHERDTQILDGPIPLWFSFGADAGLVRRDQPLFQTKQSVERLNIEPRVETAFNWKNIHIVPSFSLRETSYGESLVNQSVVTQSYLRSSREFDLDIILPSLYRIYNAPKWMGSKFKHSIEPRIEFRNISGVNDFDKIILFDEGDLVANTTQVSAMIVNRIWTKSASGEVRDWLNWEIGQEKYFDPTFGGAIITGTRNIVESTSDFGAYSFLERPRGWSPITSTLRVQPLPRFGVEWRADYDPQRRLMVDSSVTADARFDNIFASIGHLQVGCMPLRPLATYTSNPCIGQPTPDQVLSAPSDQFRGMLGFGKDNKRGWNAAFLAIYDYRTQTLQFGNAQITYNADCCAFNMQVRRLAFGARNENQYRFSFVIANIGSAGTLRKQDRLF